MDKDTMRRWAAIGGFEAEVEKLFAQLAQRDETVAHQAEQIAILTNMVAASKRAIEAQDETIAILQKALGWTDLNDGATPGLATSTTQTSTLDTE